MTAREIISVLMPVYNASDTIAEAIESILRQTDQNFEFIIVDDGSTDTTPGLIENFAERDNRIRAFYRDHKGIVAALGYGMKVSNGIYIARMDADDISYPERLEKQRNFLDLHPETGLVSCKAKYLGEAKKTAGYARYVRWVNSLISHEEISLNRFVESPLAHPSVMFRRKTVTDYGGYRRGHFPEDYELWLRWLEAGVRMEKIPSVLVRWRDRPQRLSRTHDRYSVDAFYSVKAIYLSRWLQEQNPLHPDVVVWGAGRTSRKRAELLTRYGINITHYVDVDSNKTGQTIHGRTVWDYKELPKAGECFIVSYVGLHGANERIRKYLTDLGYIYGVHYIFAA